MAENVDLIMGGFQSAAQGLNPYVRRQQEQIAQSQPLSSFEKNLGSGMQARLEHAQQLVMSGQLDPKTAALMVRLNHPLPGEPQPQTSSAPGQAQGQAPQQPPTSYMPPPAQAQAPQQSAQPSYNFAPGMSAQPSTPSPQPQAQPQSQEPIPYPAQQQQMGQRVQPTSSASTPQPRGPQTRGDMDALMRVAPYMQGQKDSADDKLLRTLLTLQSREGIAGQSNDTKVRGQNVRASVATASLNERGREADQTLQLGYDSLASKLDGIRMRLRGAEELKRMGHGMNIEVEAMKLRGQQLLQKQRSLTQLMNGIPNLNSDPGVQEAIGGLRDQIESDADQFDHDLEALQQQGTSKGRPSRYPNTPGTQGRGAPAPIPQGPAEPPANGAPPLNTSTVVREPGMSMSGGGSTVPQGVGKVKVRSRVSGKVGMLPATDPGLQDGTYERIQ